MWHAISYIVDVVIEEALRISHLLERLRYWFDVPERIETLWLIVDSMDNNIITLSDTVR